MTERDYEVIGLQLGRLGYAMGNPDLMAKRLGQAVEMIAAVLASNSKRFSKLRFYTAVYGDVGRATSKIAAEKERTERLYSGLK